MNTLPSKTLVLTLLPLILAACGGGGGDAPVADNPPANTNTSRPSTSTPTTPQNPTDNRRTSPTNNTSRPAAPTNTAANRPLDADEQRAFAASKTSAYPPIWNGRDKVEPLRITAGNATLASFDGSISRSDFRSLPNVLTTPHRAAGTYEGRLRQGRIVAEEIQAWLRGSPLAHAVEPHQLRFIA